jgi:lysophospholipase L1-like esterase
VTPLTRRIFKDGKLQNDLEPWAAATRKVAAGKQVPLLDLNAESAAAVQVMGEEAADGLAQLPPGAPPTGAAGGTEIEELPMAKPKLSFDRTHLGVKGANYFAAMVTRELAAAVPEMRPLLVR